MARKKKKFKGFKVAEKAHYCFNKDTDVKTVRQMLQCKKSLEKCVKIAQTPPEKCVSGEYCPKQSGCCWDYQKKQEEQKEGKHAA